MHGHISIKSSLSNTFFALINKNGRVILSLSAGAISPERSRRNRYFSAILAGSEFAKRTRSKGFQTVNLQIKGIGRNRDGAIRGLRAAGLKITQIIDKSSPAFNGCRAPKKRRL